jgi:hypothetical protein
MRTIGQQVGAYHAFLMGELIECAGSLLWVMMSDRLMQRLQQPQEHLLFGAKLLQ